MTRYEAIEKALQTAIKRQGFTNVELYHARAALALPEDSNENTDESRWAARCGMIQGERDIAIHALNKIARRISKEPSHSKEAMAIIAADALDKIGSVFTYCKSCGGAHPRDPVLAACQTQVTEDSKVVNAELYWLAVELADDKAQNLMELEEDIVAHGWARAITQSTQRALRYLSLREASAQAGGEPMPYKVVRDGDKVRFL